MTFRLQVNHSLYSPSIETRMQTASPALYPETTLALTSIYLSTRLAVPPISLPLDPVPWWELFDAKEEEIVNVAKMLAEVYQDWDVCEGEEDDEVRKEKFSFPTGGLEINDRVHDDVTGEGNVQSERIEGNGNGNGVKGKRRKMNVWRIAARDVPITKKGVRDLLERSSTNGRGSN